MACVICGAPGNAAPPQSPVALRDADRILASNGPHKPQDSYDVVIWYGMVWYGMVWYGMVWYGMVWYGMVWYGMVWYGMVWYGMVWYGMVWHGMV